jgi:glucose-6-phosphate-specific signal transduction histidine kinase
MKEYADGLQSLHDTNIQLEVDEKVTSLKLDMKARHEFFLIYKEALRNIAMQANDSLSLINIDLSGGKLLLKIQNSELLFKSSAETQQSKQEMKERAKLINAELDIQSDNKGVSIILLVPVH